MQNGTKIHRKAGRPRQFDERQALAGMQREIWKFGLSGTSLDSIARSAGLNRPSLAAAFGSKDAIYERTAAAYGEVTTARIADGLKKSDLGEALTAALNAAIDIYTAGGPDGCFVFSTAPSETSSSPLCREILDRALETIDAQFLSRLELERKRLASAPADIEGVAGQLGATVHSISLRARAGWSPDRLRAFAAAAVRQALVVLGDSAA